VIDTTVQSCGRIVYDTAAEADQARRRAQAHFGTSLKAARCKTCALWHLSFASTLTSRERVILRDLTFGFRAKEICENRGLTHDQFYNTVKDLIRKVGALSRTHLVAVAISIGVINIFESESTYATNRTSPGRQQPRAPRGGERRSDARA
jgi:DNA-binding CsgD family transcriptional regulator